MNIIYKNLKIWFIKLLWIIRQNNSIKMNIFQINFRIFVKSDQILK